ncbi:hypothetical protein SELMODRAFT_403094 [Selaginella moellendorffii]|uniref:Transmembrane protein n=1 Tax=Selaginella moellendorffii TaxID=88036 RepID=D8QP11_SELML|nr:hypothetical protein SELMODRAFT_403094 [Selaginella moellendorffii]
MAIWYPRPGCTHREAPIPPSWVARWCNPRPRDCPEGCDRAGMATPHEQSIANLRVYMNGNGNTSIVVYPSNEPLEFGTLGAVQGSELGAVRVSSKGQQAAGQDRQQPSSPNDQQRQNQRAYQMKEEDFPPLSFRAQGGNSSTSDMKTLTAIDWALNLLHLFILVCGGLIVIMVPVIQGGSPNFSPGWLLIILGGVTIVAGASGIGRTVGPCFWINIVFNCFAALGSIVYSLASFSNREKVARSFRSKRFSANEVIVNVLGVFFGSLARQLKNSEGPQESFERRSIALQRLSVDLYGFL